MLKRMTLVAAAALALAACDASSQDDLVSFERIALPASPVLVNGTEVIRDQSRLEMFARDQEGGLVSIPEVDFESQLVIGVFYGGTSRSGCRSDVEVVEAVRLEDDVLVVEIRPLPNLGMCDMIVYPAEMVVVSARSRDVRFVGDVPE